MGSVVGKRRFAWLLIAVFTLGALITAVRGPYRAMFPPNPAAGIRWDFGLVYSLTRAWVIGANPYEMEGVSRAWLSSDGPREADPSLNRSQGILVYPPTTLAVLAPLGAMPWSIASIVWMALNIAGMAVSIGIATGMAGLRGAWRWASFAAGVWLAPFATNMGVGQTAVVTLGLVALGQWARLRDAQEPGSRRFAWASGVMLGLATAIKPQMGLLFVVYEAGRLRWRPVLAAGLVIGLAAAVGCLRLHNSVAAWWDYWQLNLHNFTLMEDANPTRSNPQTRHHMLSLHYLLHNFTDSREFVRWLVYGVVGALSGLYLLVDLRRNRERGEGYGELASISMTAVVSLLVVYHRFYDAVLLVFPMALAIRLIADRTERAAGWALLGLGALFFVPGAVVLAMAAEKGWVPGSLTRSWFWQDLVLPHEVWALLAMSLLLIAIRARITKRST